MFNFQAARKNMVDCQIHPSGVINPQLLQAFESVPREIFVSSISKKVAYADEDVVFDDGRFILDPTVQARMIQALEPRSKDIILDIGCASGYSSAILSPLVSAVIAVENNQKYLKAAAENWQQCDRHNISPVKGALKDGCADHAPYDLVLFNGASAKIPQNLVSQLKPGGRMVLIVCPQGKRVGHVTLVEHLGGGEFSSRQLFEAASPYLQGFEPEPEFRF